MAGFTLYYGNNLEALADECAKLLKEPLDDPFEREIVIVQSKDMERWLSLQISMRHGVCMNIEFLYPNEFLDVLFSSLYQGRYEPSHFSIEVLTWKIMRILPHLIKSECETFKGINNYLDDSIARELKLYQLSRIIADLFDQYTLYRPELIKSWEQKRQTLGNPEEAWQMSLWNRLFPDLPEGSFRNRAQVKEIFINGERSAGSHDIPPRIVIFSPSVLPFYHIDIFKSLSRNLDVKVFVLSPSQEESAFEDTGQDLPGQAYRTGKTGNALISSLGSAWRHCFKRLMQMADSTKPVFISSEGKSMLAQIKRDIFECRDTECDTGRPLVADRDDLSVQIHACHSPQREVEALHDFLLHLFSLQREYQPHEVIVMASDIEVYSPYIRSVFKQRKPFAFSIADVKTMASSPVFATFFQILELPDHRFEASHIFNLLEKDIIRDSFEISESELPIIHKWITDTNIRWGIDKKHRKKAGFPEYRENSWEYGLERMLLGYAMKEEGEAFFSDILPYSEIEGSGSLLLGRFKEFIDTLSSYAGSLSESRTLQDWSALLIDMIDVFFRRCNGFEHDLASLRAAVADLGQSENSLAYLTQYTEAVSCKLVHSHLEYTLCTVSHGSGYMRGGITFAGFLPLRSIPFKVICLLGMNISAFPRKETPPAFDLIACNPEDGDRSVREGDRYLFLETLMSAGEVLYLSYTGLDIKDNSPIPPSVLVNELTEYIRENYCYAGEASGDSILSSITHYHRLHPFNTDYFTSSSTLYSYSKEHCDAALALRQRQSQMQINVAEIPSQGTLDETGGTIIQSERQSTQLPPPDPADNKVVTIEELISFFKNPVRFFLRRRLGIHLDFEEEEHPDRESFELSPLRHSDVADRYISAMLKEDDEAECYNLLRLQDGLPPLMLGRCECEIVRDETVSFVKSVKKMIGACPKRDPLEVEVKLNGFVIQGHLKDISDEGLYRYYYRSLGARHFLSVWIEHLLFCIRGDTGKVETSCIVGKGAEGKPPVRYILKKVNDPVKHLAELMEVYAEGLCRPVPFFPKTSYAFARKYQNSDDEFKALSAALNVWDGYDYKEKSDSAYTIFFGEKSPLEEPCRGEFITLAQRVYSPVLAHMEELK